ncbi:tyrosine-protein phosphatase pmp1 [Aspergillus lentulus]|uniref:protein-tyrosine-phosphatase n=1 Tax=Aspergillus lentulus TaxID=293939 RepID=A0AAN4PMU6_ASPLE|nr:tyrosine-protein phosphatase pmp1 [Aspergillus lentulus]KAF4157043.1 hypothetical protein CNMCM6069_005941 [Aspergillus lentulus]KAF4177774.1 hypothetical protein CNMCM8060_005292 [Aspergillus lentulus]KAF4189158.1 hypothetical protein CNMCM7927_009159 [Aspergillus lentulus]KAF4208681.1 hypothetical protein CNMCM8927_009278 [Aspergillus lentulus]GAQ07255.1 tyrosine-protein phosphatase pmp1 [Aspergillus lentulus]
MPVQTSPPSLPDSFPSLMSVFGGISPKFTEGEEHSAALKPLRVPPHVTVNTSRRPLPFRHRASISSVTSGSTDSSPTTTISTFDSPLAADTTPSSSPESPSAMPLSFPKFMPPLRNIEHQSLSGEPSTMSKPSQDVLSRARPESPGRRARNLKNLSLRMPPPSQSSRPAIATASVVETASQRNLSAPPSPAHIPPKSSRRKPANLTIQTPGFDRSFSNNVMEMVPSTPCGLHSLRHTESSPSLTSVFSPSFGPKGGMQLPRPVTHHGSRRPSGASEHNLSSLQSAVEEGSPAGGVLHELEEEEDHLDSRESNRRNERGYPNGPVQIYDSGVYLYLEPTMQEAAQFDVVVNVAKEVANPFANARGDNGTVMSAWRSASAGAKRSSTAEPPTAVSEISFKSAFEYPPSETESPVTPCSDSSRPEYIHVGWDHNSEILEDLYPLCELIDSRVSQGKKVLVHCQLGASRSASLVIAYGLYKNRHLDFNSMYEIVKGRSRWVGPNMSLIYQLTDFRSRLQQQGGASSKPAPEEWFVNGPRRGSEPQPSRSGRTTEANVTPPGGSSCHSGYSRLATPASRSQTSSSTLSVPSTERSTPPSVSPWRIPKSLSHKRSLSPRPLPLRQRFETAQTAAKDVGTHSLAPADALDKDTVEDPLGLFSPRTSQFLAPSLAPPFPDGLEDRVPGGPHFRTETADPRSPPPGNERLIMRNIDEFL